MYNIEQEYFVDEKLRYVFNIKVGNKNMQFVTKQLPAGAISYFIPRYCTCIVMVQN